VWGASESAKKEAEQPADAIIDTSKPCPPPGFSPFNASKFVKLKEATIALFSCDTGKFLSFTENGGMVRQVSDAAASERCPPSLPLSLLSIPFTC